MRNFEWRFNLELNVGQVSSIFSAQYSIPEEYSRSRRFRIRCSVGCEVFRPRVWPYREDVINSKEMVVCVSSRDFIDIKL